ncbi:hypothetical protein [Halorhabdus amylolytica]|uniref:hypothetical protein n=1 Tax=Halorhabdus amylolytica TaxID=2559573 RepID=UPI0010AA3311|nr:hypothetical protein [Halorhabdus amylolytica]
MTVTFVVTLALPAIVVALAGPHLALAFVAGLATARVYTRLPAATRLVGRFRSTDTPPGRPAGQ